MRIVRGLRDAVYLLDRMSPLIAKLRASTISQTSRSFVGRFCAVIPHALVPISVSKSRDLYARASIEPSSVIYVHENVVVISRYEKEGSDLFKVLLMGDYVPAVDLDKSDDELLSVLATSIADALLQRDRWRDVVLNLPSNLRTLVSSAMEQLRNAEQSSLTFPLVKQHNFVEIRLWSCGPGHRARDSAQPYEISFVKGVGPGYLKMKFLGVEVDLRPAMPVALESVMFKLVGKNIVDEIVNRVYRAARIVSVGLSLAK